MLVGAKSRPEGLTESNWNRQVGVDAMRRQQAAVAEAGDRNRTDEAAVADDH